MSYLIFNLITYKISKTNNKTPTKNNIKPNLKKPYMKGNPLENSTQTFLKVRYCETDQMGIVHHSNYTKYLEVARLEWLTHFNLSYKEMEEKGVFLPVYDLQIAYKQSAYFDDELTIHTQLAKDVATRMIFDYKIYNQHNQLLVTASTTLVFVNAETRKPMVCPDFIKNTLTSKKELKKESALS